MCDVGENLKTVLRIAARFVAITCEPGEDPMICPQDCAAETACGDAREAGESTDSAPQTAWGSGMWQRRMNLAKQKNCPADCTTAGAKPETAAVPMVNSNSVINWVHGKTHRVM